MFFLQNKRHGKMIRNDSKIIFEMIRKSFENYVEVIQNIPPGLNKKNKKILNIFDLFSRILKLNKHNQIRQR